MAADTIAPTVFEIGSTPDTVGNDMQDGYAALHTWAADIKGLRRDEYEVTPFEFFGVRTDGRAEHRSYCHYGVGNMAVAKVLVKS